MTLLQERRYRRRTYVPMERTQTFQFLSGQYFEQVYFKYSPTAGTSAGLHQYDSQLEDYSAAERAAADCRAA